MVLVDNGIISLWRWKIICLEIYNQPSDQE